MRILGSIGICDIVKSASPALPYVSVTRLGLGGIKCVPVIPHSNNGATHAGNF